MKYETYRCTGIREELTNVAFNIFLAELAKLQC
jgi:hypothetical protein